VDIHYTIERGNCPFDFQKWQKGPFIKRSEEYGKLFGLDICSITENQWAHINLLWL